MMPTWPDPGARRRGPGGAAGSWEHALREPRQAAQKANQEADRASVRMEGYGGPAQPSPTIGQCLNGGYA